MKNIAVILAGGTGQRLGEALPKQFLKVAGKKVIEHTLDAFQNHPLIDEIIVVSNPSYIEEMESIAVRNEYTKLKKILAGGKERYHSSLAAINACEDESANLIFHDAVRPLVNDRILSDCIVALKTYEAVDVAIKTTDTIIQVNDAETICGIPARYGMDKHHRRFIMQRSSGLMNWLCEIPILLRPMIVVLFTNICPTCKCISLKGNNSI